MNKFKIVVIIFILIISLLIIYPFINLDTGEAIYVFSYSTDIDKYVNKYNNVKLYETWSFIEGALICQNVCSMISRFTF